MSDQANVWVIERPGVRGTAYHIRWLDPRTGRQRSQSCGRDKRRAESKAAIKRQELAAGIDNHVQRVTWSQFVERVLDAKRAAGIGHKQVSRIELTLRQLAEYRQPATPATVTHSDVLAYLKSRIDAGKANATVEGDRQRLYTAFNVAIRLRLVSENPLAGISKIRFSPSDWHLYEAGEIDALLNVADKRFWGPLLYLSWLTAFRKGELLSLTWADVDVSRGKLSVNPRKATDKLLAFEPKSHTRRTVDLPKHSAVWLQRLKVASDPENPYVLLPTTRYRQLLVSRPLDMILWVNNFNRAWQALCMRAGVAVGEFHSLRKSRITLWLEDGVKPHVVRELAGHKSLETTMQYYTKVRDSARDAASASSGAYRPHQLLTISSQVVSGKAS